MLVVIFYLKSVTKGKTSEVLKKLMELAHKIAKIIKLVEDAHIMKFRYLSYLL